MLIENGILFVEILDPFAVRSKLLFHSTIWKLYKKKFYTQFDRVQNKPARYTAYLHKNSMHKFDHNYKVNRANMAFN